MAELLQDRRRALAAVVVLVVALALAGRTFLRPSHASVPPPLRPRAGAATASKPKQVYVDVVGAVRRPGLYRVRTGARVADAVARAGGPARKADLQLVNLAALVADGEQVVVPRQGGGTTAAAQAPGSAPSGPVHLNSATLEQLDALPGVGPVTAQKIIDYRTQHGGFSSVDELDAVSGIGPARLADLRPLVAP